MNALKNGINAEEPNEKRFIPGQMSSFETLLTKPSSHLVCLHRLSNSMADIERHAQARWTGALRDGSGTTTTGSGIINQAPYSVPSRFENGKGTNPEELLAAAHASCFSMMLAKILADRQNAAREISTRATITMTVRNGSPKIVRIHLDTEVEAEGLNETTLKEVAAQAKEQCPVSVLLRPGLDEITLSARLKTS